MPEGKAAGRWDGFEDFEVLQLRDAVRQQAPVAVTAAMLCQPDERERAAVSTASLLALELDMSTVLHARGIDGPSDMSLFDIVTLTEAIRRGEAKPAGAR